MRLKYLFGAFELDPASRELLRDGHPVALRPRALDCLVYLVENRERAVGRDELISAVWGRVDASDTVVAQTLLRVRKALDDAGNRQEMIRTLPRFGYRWVAPVREVPASRDAYAGGADEAGRDAGTPTPYVPAEADVDAGVPMADAAEDVADAAETPAGATAPAGKRRRLLRIGLPLLAVLVLAAGLASRYFPVRHAGGFPGAGKNDAVLVMPVVVVPKDTENAWVRLGAMDYMAARLRSSGVNVLPSELATRLGTMFDGTAWTPAMRTKLLDLAGARWAALPDAQRTGNAWQVRLRIVDAGTERWLQANGDTALAATARATDLWLRQLGGEGGREPPPTPVAERLQRLDAEIMAGRLQEARRLLLGSSPGERADPRFLYREAKLEFRAGNLDASAGLFQQALDRASPADVQIRIGALQGLGTTERARNRIDAAEQRFRQSLALLEALPPDRFNSRMIGLDYQGLGVIRAQRGDLDGAIGYLGQARVWIQRSGDVVLLAASGHNLGKAEALHGDYLQALREFDRAIEVFERFAVNDYLANTLSEKARLQLLLARPADAAQTTARAEALLPGLEGDGGDVAIEILATKARIQLARGQLGDAARTLARLHMDGIREAADPRLQELSMRLLLAQGDAAGAAKLAAGGPPPAGAGDGLMLASVQAALRSGNLPLARAWLSGSAPAGEQDPRYHAIALSLGQALLARAEGDRPASLEHARRAATLEASGQAPEAEIQAGVLQALILLDARQSDAASAIMGRLEKYVDSDYRVAWALLALYRTLGDEPAAAAARARVDALRGDRDIGIEPLL
jgi:DNA-binding winged helix-turn-helix (wHTH) protein/tetratricopeptide (TPR) repeat protein